MAQNAYCNECGGRVPLTDTGLCLYGHPRSALRDVRDGEIVSAEPSSRVDSDAGKPSLTSKEEAISKTIGRLVVIVPATLVVAIGLYTGYAAGVQFGQSKLEAWLSSIGSMLLTGLVVAALVWDRRRKMRR